MQMVQRLGGNNPSKPSQIIFNKKLKKTIRYTGVEVKFSKIHRRKTVIFIQKINKIILIIGAALFCPLVFSSSFLFNPGFFSPHPLPSQVTIPQNTQIKPLCPPSLPIQLCLAFTSFPLVQTQLNAPPSPTMFTPFSHKTKDISSKRRKRLLSKYRWRSYQYSRKTRKLESLSEKERDIEPEDDYYRLHIQSQPTANRLPKVIQEEKVNGQKSSHVGELRGVPTEEILNIVEEGVSPQFEQPAPSTAIDRLQTTPQTSTEEEGLKEEKEEPEEEPAVQAPIITETPVTAIALNYTSVPKQCSDMNSEHTEAVSICVSCSRETNRRLENESLFAFGTIPTQIGGRTVNTTPDAHYKSQLENKIRGKVCHGSNIQSIQNNFEKTCGNISFEDYVSEVLVCESCKHKVPPVFMLSMISLESDGRCKARGDDDNSHGLYQINTKYYPDPPRCDVKQKEQIQKAELAELKSGPKCLGNPVVNTQKSIEILKEKYRSVNKSQSDFDCQSSSMNTRQTNQWRKALAGYNGGQSHIQRIQNMPKPEVISSEEWEALDEWQKIRLQYFFYQSYTDRSGKIRTISPKVRMGNLAHVETALGSTGNAESQLSLFSSWKEELGDQIDLSKCQ